MKNSFQHEFSPINVPSRCQLVSLLYLLHQVYSRNRKLDKEQLKCIESRPLLTLVGHFSSLVSANLDYFVNKLSTCTFFTFLVIIISSLSHLPHSSFSTPFLLSIWYFSTVLSFFFNVRYNRELQQLLANLANLCCYLR